MFLFRILSTWPEKAIILYLADVSSKNEHGALNVLTSVKKQDHSRRSIVNEYGATNSKLNDVYSCVLTSTKPHEERSEPFSFFKPEHEKAKTMLEPDFMFSFGTKPLTKPKIPFHIFVNPGTK